MARHYLDDLQNDWLWSEVAERLRAGVFHVTGRDGWEGIRDKQAIVPNDGTLPPTFEKSKQCHGRKLNAVCLFDFETPAIEVIADRWTLNVSCIFAQIARPRLTQQEEELSETHKMLAEAFMPAERQRPVFLIHFADKARLPGPWQYWRPSRIDDAIPYVECWHKAPMPLLAATSVHIATWHQDQPVRRWKILTIEEALKTDLTPETPAEDSEE